MAKSKTKVDTVKSLINMDPSHPGSLTPQQYTKKNGKKTKKYWLWQSSFQGKKKAVRIPDEAADEIQKLIDNSKKKAKTKDKKVASELKAYNKALEKQMKADAKKRKANGTEFGSK